MSITKRMVEDRISRNKKKNAVKYPLEKPFVGLSHRMLESPAWLALSYSSTWLCLFMYRAKYKTGQNEFPLTYQTIKALKGMSPVTFRKAIVELTSLGFIEIVRHGGFPLPSLYRLSDEWRTLSQSDANKIKAAIRRGDYIEKSCSSFNPEERIEQLEDLDAFS